MPGRSALDKEEQARVARALAREKESPEQRWLRSTIREELTELLEDFFSGGEGDDKPKSDKGGFLGVLGLGGDRAAG
jgi:hypothetical protein